MRKMTLYGEYIATFFDLSGAEITSESATGTASATISTGLINAIESLNSTLMADVTNSIDIIYTDISNNTLDSSGNKYPYPYSINVKFNYSQTNSFNSTSST